MTPEGFGPIFRSSPMLDALGGFMSRGSGESLEIGLLVGAAHLNGRGRLHGGVIATLADTATGYLLVARTGGQRWITAKLTVDYRSAAAPGEWLQVLLDRTEAEGRKCRAIARILSGDRVVADVDVLFVQAQH
ncbi:MAG: hypothetical protein RLZ51_932 [Pseudomonadota bacterium]|jgi:acyl-coenzyme A thioesterase 13